MSLFQLSEYMLWKSLKKNKTIPFKQEILQNKQEILDNDMICRVCTNPADIPLTNRLNDMLIMSAIRAVANISINEADYYPKYICQKCLEDLKVAFEFKKKCEASDMMFRKAISSDTLLYTATKPLLIHDFSLIIHQMKQKRLESQKKAIKQICFSNISDNVNNVPVDSDNAYDDVKYSDSDDDFLSTISQKWSQNEKNKMSCKRSKKTKHRKEENITKKPDDNNLKSDYIQTRILNLLKTSNADVHVHGKRKQKKQITKKIRIRKCKRCDIKFDTQEAFLEHKKENSCSYKPCPLCGKLVLNLAMHEKIMHLRSDKYTCDQCGKIYYSSSALRNHMNVHKDTAEYSCDLCPYKGKRKAYLVCHMRVHTGEHRYLCSMCPAKFSNPSNLSKHQLVHYSKKFECSKCKKTFRLKKVLKEHYDSAHLNIRYRCSICGRDLSTRKKLLSHELRVHKREKHKLFHIVQKVTISNETV